MDRLSDDACIGTNSRGETLTASEVCAPRPLPAPRPPDIAALYDSTTSICSRVQSTSTPISEPARVTIHSMLQSWPRWRCPSDAPEIPSARKPTNLRLAISRSVQHRALPAPHAKCLKPSIPYGWLANSSAVHQAPGRQLFTHYSKAIVAARS